MNLFLVISALLVTSSNPFNFNPFDNIKNKIIKFKKKDFSIFDNNIIDYLRSRSKNKYTIINKKSEQMYDINLFSEKYPLYKDYKVISISPGGLKGFYLMGVVNYIKTNYDLSNCLFTGASAGAWSSLLMSYNGDDKKIINNVLNMDFNNIKNIFELELALKKLILDNTIINDYDLEKIFIGVTVIKNLDLSTNIFYNFKNLEDSLDCCIASSHIPFLTGGLINKYNNEISIDGGFSNYPYLDLNNTILHINPQMWKEEITFDCAIDDIFQDINKLNFEDSYLRGYQDTKNNKHILDNILTRK
tara:strand:- start:1348 stop:2256 length:909 start_codon:yes stop_codon:yes gene_type:complete